LQHAGNDNVGLLADQAPPVFDDDHRSIFKVADALMKLFPFANHGDVQLLAGQHDRFDRVGELVNVEHRDAFDVRDAVEIVIVGHELGAKLLRQAHQPRVHVARGHVGEISFADLDCRELLQAAEDVEAPAAASSLERVDRIGDCLQLAQNEARNDQLALEESALDNFNDPSVHDRRGVDQLCDAAGAADRPRHRHDPNLCADRCTEVCGEDCKDQIEHDRDVRSGPPEIRDQLEDDAFDEKGNQKADDQPDRSARNLGRSKAIHCAFG
jgi:hypothetical protein